MLAHVPLLNDFVAGIAMLLKPEGTVTIEFPHLLKLIEHVEFDTIYHEHYSYISLYAIEQVFGRHGLRIYDAEELPTHGGSLAHFCHPRRSGRDSRTARRCARCGRKKPRPVWTISIRTGVSPNASRPAGARCSAFSAQAKSEGKIVAAYGAAAKGNTLLNFCGVTGEDITMVADRNPHKQSKFLAGHAYSRGLAGGVDAGEAGLRADAAVESARRDQSSARRDSRMGRAIRHSGARGAHPSMIFTESTLGGVHVIELDSSGG